MSELVMLLQVFLLHLAKGTPVLRGGSHCSGKKGANTPQEIVPGEIIYGNNRCSGPTGACADGAWCLCRRRAQG